LRSIARAGKRLRTEHFDVRAVASLSRLDHARIGLVIPKHGRSAVDRNRLKRRLRELCRLLLLPGAPPLDVVIHARPSAYRVTFDELERIIRHLTGQLPRLAERLSAATDSSDGAPLVASDDLPSV
jgi:ribonuclease P protein component